MKVHRGWLPLGLLLIGGGAGLVFGPHAPRAHAQATPAPNDNPMHIAVVDYQSLLKNHPEFEKLRQLDEQLGLLKEEKDWLPHKEALDARALAYEKMAKKVEAGKAEMEAEKAKLEGEMAGLSGSLQAEMNAELNRLKSQYDAEIQEMIRKAMPARPSRPEAPMPQRIPQSRESMSEFHQSLLLVRQRNLTAHKLELEKSIRSQIEAERAHFDSQLAAHEDEIAAQYQEEKLNLQLKLQVTQDEAEQQKLQDRLSAISEEISTKKAARRSEGEATFNEFRRQKNAEFDAQMSSYARKLDVEVQNQLRGHAPDPVPVPDRPETTTAVNTKPPVDNKPPAELQAAIKKKIEEAQATIKSRMAAKEAELRGAMEAKGEQARQRLMAKQREIQKRLELAQDELRTLFEQKQKNVGAATKAKIDALGKQIDKLQKERDELYARMIEDLNKVVGDVAKKKDVPMVLGQVYYNRTCQDLTDYSMVGVKQLGSH